MKILVSLLGINVSHDETTRSTRTGEEPPRRMFRREVALVDFLPICAGSRRLDGAIPPRPRGGRIVIHANSMARFLLGRGGRRHHAANSMARFLPQPWRRIVITRTLELVRAVAVDRRVDALLLVLRGHPDAHHRQLQDIGDDERHDEGE